MGAFVHAVEIFWAQVSAISWGFLALGLVCHLAKMACRSRAWQGILAAAYPTASIRWRDVAGAYAAGVGVNAIVPVRGGPGLDVLPRLRAFDLAWIIDHPVAFTAIAVSAAVLVAVLLVKASRRVGALRRHLAQGFAIFHDWRTYVRTVASWQLADWVLRLATIYCFLGAFGIGVELGISDGLRDALLVQVTQSVSALVPLTPSGIGTEQALVVYLFAGRVPTGALIGFSVGMQLVLVVANVIVGFGAILLALRTLRWRRHLEREHALLTSVAAVDTWSGPKVRVGDQAQRP
jgi:uncharacterized membrane protein YbhN (UPF0104 family)